MTNEELINQRKKEIAELTSQIDKSKINYDLQMGSWVSYKESEISDRERMTKKSYINNIKSKLCSNTQLNPAEISTIISALNESNKFFQKPYYEVIYHDEFDNIDARIMEPIASRKIDMNGYSIQEDRFDLNFRRIIRDE